jgi:hypothetical protein
MMESVMPRSVQLPTPRPSIESLIKQLRIPKARQKKLRAMMDEARAELVTESENAPEQNDSLHSASQAR